ncbi:tetracycline resistance MFS efflux pump [Priestia megaterium]|uniref:tetracycline resistance MFS efflux pump n=1 Tax=Priestia TaxID=2800373 RepID=UPI0005C61F60|nr:tetracycline resistance MFS efflux pump [Priestia megaterium]NGY82495.1 tetracycline resistance MFS efflux pump [Priestia megaterium]
MDTSINKHPLTFGFITVFLTGLGLTIVSPVLPFLVKTYTSSPSSQATAVTLLTSIYALSVFLAAPVLGALSDRYGRRPVLIISLIGSAFGYFIFGLGGSLWILFLGRTIEGLTGGEISAIFAYFADITSSNERTKYFGWISAVVGVGTALGPIIGGALATFGNSVPMYAGTVITLLNAIYGYFFMPESLEKSRRSFSISVRELNPFIQLSKVFSFKSVKWLLIAGFLVWIPNGSLQAIFSQFSIDTFAWQPIFIGLTFSIIGVLDIFSQTIIMPRLLKFLTDKKIALLGMISQIIGFILISISALTDFYFVFIVGMIFFGLGDSVFGPSFNGMLSKSVSDSEQGHILGGAQSIQSLARFIGPIIGGQLYSVVSHTTPAVMGVVLIGISTLVLSKKHRYS